MRRASTSIETKTVILYTDNIVMKKSAIFTFVFSLLFLFTACSDGNDREKVNIVRYDKVQYEYVEFDSYAALKKMQVEYRPMSKLLVENILEIGNIDDVDINTKFKDYFRDSLLLQLNNDAEAKFEDLSPYENELGIAFTALKKHFPEIKIPKVYTQLSALNESVIVDDELIGISLDKYMGSNYPLYSKFYYSYQRKTMIPERMVFDCIYAYMQSIYPFPENAHHDLCSIMIYYGIINYIIADLSGYSQMRIMNYTREEEKWCRDSETDTYKYMLLNRHLYSTNFMVIRKYMKASPYTSFFGKGSPDRIGLWVGMRIVESYMKNNKGISYQELMNTDYYKILTDSKYLD